MLTAISLGLPPVPYYPGRPEFETPLSSIPDEHYLGRQCPRFSARRRSHSSRWRI